MMNAACRRTNTRFRKRGSCVWAENIHLIMESYQIISDARAHASVLPTGSALARLPPLCVPFASCSRPAQPAGASTRSRVTPLRNATDSGDELLRVLWQAGRQAAVLLGSYIQRDLASPALSSAVVEGKPVAGSGARSSIFGISGIASGRAHRHIARKCLTIHGSPRPRPVCQTVSLTATATLQESAAF